MTELHAAASPGVLDDLCEEMGVDVLGVFGSAAHSDPAPANDLDVAVRFVDVNRSLELIDGLVALTLYDDIDLVVITGAHPGIEAAALCGQALYESRPGRFADEQMAALGRSRDTAWLRDLDLARLTT